MEERGGRFSLDREDSTAISGGRVGAILNTTGFSLLPTHHAR